MPASRSTKTSQERLQAVARQRQALDLRMQGLRWQEIADQLGYASTSGPQMAVRAALDKTLREPAKQMRALTTERLTAINRTIRPVMLTGDVKAADRVMAAIDRLCRLHGLYPEPRIELHQHTDMAVVLAEARVITGLQGVLGPLDELGEAHFPMLGDGASAVDGRDGADERGSPAR